MVELCRTLVLLLDDACNFGEGRLWPTALFYIRTAVILGNTAHHDFIAAGRTAHEQEDYTLDLGPHGLVHEFGRTDVST